MIEGPRVLALTDTGEPLEAVPLITAHQPPGILHLAVSVQVVDRQGRWLLQRRAPTKRPFGDRWANSCCTHPHPGEGVEAAGQRRVDEELGLTVSDLVLAGTFTYRADDPVSGLVEHEHDHVFLARVERPVVSVDPREVGEIAWLPFDEALQLVSGDGGAPWAAEVLKLSDVAHRT